MEYKSLLFYSIDKVTITLSVFLYYTNLINSDLNGFNFRKVFKIQLFNV